MTVIKETPPRFQPPTRGKEGEKTLGFKTFLMSSEYSRLTSRA